METIIYHHGIKGQKWGVRRFQKKDGSLTPAGKKRYLSGYNQKPSNIILGKRIVSSNMNKRLSEISKFQGSGEELVSYALMTATTIASFAISTAVRNKIQTTRKMNELERLKVTSSFSDISKVPKIKGKEAPSRSVKVVNNDYPSQGTTMNCTFCTTAMALREKGFDVVARKTDSAWPGKELFSKTFNVDTVKMQKRQTKSDMMDSLLSIGDGAYGNLFVYWKMGGGHSVFWKNEGGRTHIYDGQSGKEYDTSDINSSKFLDSIDLRIVQYNRLDNAEPTDYAFALVDKRRT